MVFEVVCLIGSSDTELTESNMFIIMFIIILHQCNQLPVEFHRGQYLLFLIYVHDLATVSEHIFPFWFAVDTNMFMCGENVQLL